MDIAHWLRRETDMDGKERPGWRTTEFWLTALAVLVGLLLASGALPADSAVARAVGAIASALASTGYSWSRAKVKTE